MEDPGGQDWRYNPPRYRQGPGHMLRPEVGEGGGGSGNGGGKTEPRRENLQGLTGMLEMLREVKGGRLDREWGG